MPNYFEERYGKDKFEMIEVKDMAEEGCLDDAIEGMSRSCLVIND
jgi:hypothetical protein